MSNGTVITLGSSPTQIATFEEAFGQHSSANGRGRAKRSARKDSKRSAKSVQKSNRQQQNSENRSRKIASKTDRKIQKKSGRALARSTKKGINTSSRNDRRVMKGETRNSKRKSRDDGSSYEEPEYNDDDQFDEGSEEDSRSNDQRSNNNYEDNSDEGYDDDDDYDDQDYDDDYDEDYDDEDYDDEDDSDEESVDDDYDDYDDEDWASFDAASSADGSISVNPKMQILTDKIEWNKELVSRLRAKIKTASKDDVAKIKAEINNSLSRIDWLEGKLTGFTDNSKSPDQTILRRRHVGLAKRGSINKRAIARNKTRNSGLTNVQKELTPEISKNEIESPKKSSNATGLNGIDNQEDYDAPSPRIIEITSNADGDKKKFPIKPILIGVGVAGLIITIIVLVKKSNKK